MGCAGSKQSAEFARNKSIQAKLTADKNSDVKVKLLILGSGDSGKTTLRKQMMNIYTNQFESPYVRKELADVVVGNVIQGFQAILLASAELAMPIVENKDSQALLLSLPENSGLTPDIIVAIQTLIKDKQFLHLYEKRSLFQLQDCWKSFADACALQENEWGGSKWIPTIDECIRARVRTSGIIEETFSFQGALFRIYDAGGQRAERRKWIHCFDHVTAVIFVAASSEYDQSLFEDNTVNRLQESIDLFAETCNSKWFLKTPMILFLNKKDLFIEKFLVQKIPLNTSGIFPMAPEDNTNLNEALSWVAEQFSEVQLAKEKTLYIHHTTATDVKNIESVFDDCSSIIVNQSLFKSGLLGL